MVICFMFCRSIRLLTGGYRGVLCSDGNLFHVLSINIRLLTGGYRGVLRVICLRFSVQYGC